jgi:hypothetical protein
MKSVYTLIIASLLTIVAGLWWLSTQPLPEPEPEPAVVLPAEPDPEVMLPVNAGPERGSPEWCDAMLDLPGGEWTDRDTRTFAEHCLLD